MKEILIVGFGGFVGSVARFKTGALFLHRYEATQFPWGTFTVNIVGCFLVGIIASIIERVSFYNAELRLLLITGFLGGFTTFSAFGLETTNLFYSGHTYTAFLYVSLSILASLVAVWIGMKAI